MKETERNIRLMNLIEKLYLENDTESIELLKTFVDNDTPSIKKSFEIMTKSSPISLLFGLNNMSEMGKNNETIK